MNRIEPLLRRWAAWMEIPETGLGYPSTWSAHRFGWGTSQDFEALCKHHLDDPQILAIDAVINDPAALKPAYRQAIYAVHLRHKWQQDTELDETYEEATQALEQQLEKKGVIGH